MRVLVTFSTIGLQKHDGLASERVARGNFELLMTFFRAGDRKVRADLFVYLDLALIFV